jgi:4-hydroxybenzoate polyprenyltransferase
MSLSPQQQQFTVGQWLYQGFLKILIYPSLWVSAGVGSLTYFTQETLGLTHDWRPVIFIFFAALIPYNLDRILDSYVQTIPDAQAQSYFRHRGILLLPVVVAVGLAILLYNAPSAVRLVSCAGIAPLIYGLPLLPLGRGKNRRWYRLKDIPGTKAWIVAGIVTYAVVAVPLAYAGVTPDLSALLTALFLLVLTGTNSHLFDLRDVKSDRQKGVLTLPLMIGVRTTRILWTALNLSLLIFLSRFWVAGLTIPLPQILLPVILINLSSIWLVNPDTPRNVYSIALDGCLFLPAMLTEMLNY